MIYGIRILIADKVSSTDVLRCVFEVFSSMDEVQLVLKALEHTSEIWVRHEERISLGLAPLDMGNCGRSPTDEDFQNVVRGTVMPETAPWLWEDTDYCWPPLAVAKAAEIMADLMEQRHPAVSPSYNTAQDEYLAGFDEESQAPAKAGFPAYIGGLFRDFAELCRRLDAAGAERLTVIADEESFSTASFRIVT